VSKSDNNEDSGENCVISIGYFMALFDDDWLAKLFTANLTVVFWGYPMVIDAVT
jgi:hypothetical protein